MLSDVLDNAMERANRIEKHAHTKATKFSNVFRTSSINNYLNEFYSEKKLAKYTKNSNKNFYKSVEQTDIKPSVSEIIVENPDDIKVNIDFSNSIGRRVPFFKSIQIKLNNIYK